MPVVFISDFDFCVDCRATREEDEEEDGLLNNKNMDTNGFGVHSIRVFSNFYWILIMNHYRGSW